MIRADHGRLGRKAENSNEIRKAEWRSLEIYIYPSLLLDKESVNHSYMGRHYLSALKG